MTLPTQPTLPIRRIVSGRNPREYFDPGEMKELEDGIRAVGVLEPIVVRPIPGADLFKIIASERCWRAAKSSRSARRMLHRLTRREAGSYCYWLDIGNTEATAQVVLGEPAQHATGHSELDGLRLPCVTELFPELLDESAAEDNQPSCSVRMSLASQGLFVNDIAVRFAAQLLYELFSKGRLSAHGVVVNLESKRSGPIEINPETWERFGFRHSSENGGVAAAGYCR